MKIEQQHLHKYVHIQVNKEMRKNLIRQIDIHHQPPVFVGLIGTFVKRSAFAFFFCTKKKWIWIILCHDPLVSPAPSSNSLTDREKSHIHLVTKPIPSNPFIYTCTHSCRIPLSATQSGQAVFFFLPPKKKTHTKSSKSKCICIVQFHMVQQFP